MNYQYVHMFSKKFGMKKTIYIYRIQKQFKKEIGFLCKDW